MRNRNRRDFDNQVPTGFNNTYIQKRDNFFFTQQLIYLLKYVDVYLKEGIDMEYCLYSGRMNSHL